MKKLTGYLREEPLSLLLPLFPLAVLARFFGWSPTIEFLFSAVGIIPLAGFIGKSTETLAGFIGPRMGGLLNATLGNAAELIITLVAIKAGLLNVVKASITGSIIGNLLLVMGFAMVLGGLRHGLQTFNRRNASNNVILLALAVLALVIPSLFSHTIGSDTSTPVEILSLGVAIIMIVLYAVGLLYSFKTPKGPLAYVEEANIEGGWSLKSSLIVLALSTAGVVWLSEVLVGAVEPAMDSLGLSELFLGVILIPIIGNAAEHLVAVQVARKNKMELSVEIAISSSLQIALFVAPVLVFVSLAFGHPLTLIFNPFELLALGAAVIIAILVSSDGESNWLEGATLIGVYLILSLAFFFV